VITPDKSEKTRFLVLHDYGMGALWWWVWARSAQEIVLALAEVEVVDDPDSIAEAETWSLEEVDLDASDPNSLSDARAERDAQRDQPGFGALVGRERVYLSEPEEYDDGVTVYLSELGPDGRKLRQVEIGPDGRAIKTDESDSPINAPLDLYDPQYVALEIDNAAFEAAWDQAQWEEPEPE